MRSSSLITFTWLAGALLAASGCSVITSLADWTFGDDDPGQMDASPGMRAKWTRARTKTADRTVLPA